MFFSNDYNMEYKTVEFWEDILSNFLEKPKITWLWDAKGFRKYVWSNEDSKEWIRKKAFKFEIVSTYKNLFIGKYYLFAGEHMIDKKIRIEFLQWLINDLKNEQECIDNLTSIG